MRKAFYDRQVKIAEVGNRGQERLKNSRVMVVGVGGLGCASSTYLARAGVGTIVLVDPDRVNESDLGRQTLYAPDDVSRFKVEVAADSLQRSNPDVACQPLPVKLSESNIELLARDCDVIVDGTDDLAPREAMNAYALRTRVPAVFGGAVGWNGYLTVVKPGGPCFHCIWGGSDAAPRCSEAGIVGPLVGAVGCMQAVETMKLILAKGSSLSGKLVLYDGFAGCLRVVKVRRLADCPVCSILQSKMPPGA
ncbi:MAG: HesA/MoeB/ThiF family protein [Fimbriimonadaceae bacterium]